jgi:hypothetical protein
MGDTITSASLKLWRSLLKAVRRSLPHRFDGSGSLEVPGQNWRGTCYSILSDQCKHSLTTIYAATLSYVSRRTSRYWQWLQSSSYAVRTCYKKYRVCCQSDRPHGLLNISLSGATQMAVNPPRSVPTRPNRRKEARSFSTSHSWYQAQPSPGDRRMSVTVNTPSSRGSWSGLFNTGSVRQFMTGAQNSPDTGSPGVTDIGFPGRLPVPGATKPKEASRALSRSPLKRGVAKSWSESSPHGQRNLSALGTWHPSLSESPPTEKVEKPLNNKKLVVVIALHDNNRWETTDP